MTFPTFMPLSLISLMRFPGFVVASRWKVYWLAPAAAMGFTHSSGRDTIMCMSATETELYTQQGGTKLFMGTNMCRDFFLPPLTKKRFLAYWLPQALHHGMAKRDIGDKVPLKGKQKQLLSNDLHKLPERKWTLDTKNSVLHMNILHVLNKY